MTKELNIAELTALLKEEETKLADYQQRANMSRKEIRHLKSLISEMVKGMFQSDQPEMKMDPSLNGWKGF